MPREAERAVLVCVSCGSNRSLEVEVEWIAGPGCHLGALSRMWREVQRRYRWTVNVLPGLQRTSSALWEQLHRPYDV